VVGREDAAGLTALCGCVALKPGQTATAVDLRSWVRGRVAGFKVPRQIEILPELPRTASGKIQRFRLRASG
jgi:benzoate-CoA ligase